MPIASSVFGALDCKTGIWNWPLRRDKFARYRSINATFKKEFLKGLQQLFDKNELTYHQDYTNVSAWVKDKTWVVHNTIPTANPKVISEYLGRYISRVGISNNRLKLDQIAKEVLLEYKDYRRQKKGEAAPKAYKKMQPLVAIDQILQHVLPRYFQKARHYGLHHPITRKKQAKNIVTKVSNLGQTVRKVFEILSLMLGYPSNICQDCGSIDNFETTELSPHEMKAALNDLKNKSPPKQNIHIDQILAEIHKGKQQPMSSNNQNRVKNGGNSGLSNILF